MMQYSIRRDAVVFATDAFDSSPTETLKDCAQTLSSRQIAGRLRGAASTHDMLAWDANSSCGMASSSRAAEPTKAPTRLSRCSALKAADWMMKATLRTVSTLQDDSHTCAAGSLSLRPGVHDSSHAWEVGKRCSARL